MERQDREPVRVDAREEASSMLMLTNAAAGRFALSCAPARRAWESVAAADCGHGQVTGSGVSPRNGFPNVAAERAGAAPRLAPAFAAAAAEAGRAGLPGCKAASAQAECRFDVKNQLFGQQKTQLHTMWALRGLNPGTHQPDR